MPPSCEAVPFETPASAARQGKGALQTMRVSGRKQGSRHPEEGL